MAHVCQQMHARKSSAPATPANTGPTEPASPTPTEVFGRAVGRLLAPIFGLVASKRHGRALHLTGTVCAAEVVAVAEDPVIAPLARRFVGAAVVRLSGANWRRPGPPEVLGCAIRFRNDRPLAGLAAPEDQDLLFATLRRLWQLVPAMIRTHQRDYLHNTYYTASPLELPGLGLVELRLVPAPTPVQPGSTRALRLDAAMQSGIARLRLDIKRERRPWQPLCDVRLRGRLELDERELQYTPFHMGLGLRPRGFIQAIRAAVYAASQSARARV